MSLQQFVPYVLSQADTAHIFPVHLILNDRLPHVLQNAVLPFSPSAVLKKFPAQEVKPVFLFQFLCLPDAKRLLFFHFLLLHAAKIHDDAFPVPPVQLLFSDLPVR